MTGAVGDPPVPADGPDDDLASLLGREPAGAYEIVVRDQVGAPAVIANDPLLLDGTPMPTRYWLVDQRLRQAVSRLEADGGVRQAEAAVDPAELADAHRRYAAERDALLPRDHQGPVPTGGVGGTRRGVKCLHAHLAWWLAGGEDPVGRWTAAQLEIERPVGASSGQTDGGAAAPGGASPEGDQAVPDQ